MALNGKMSGLHVHMQVHEYIYAYMYMYVHVCPSHGISACKYLLLYTSTFVCSSASASRSSLCVCLSLTRWLDLQDEQCIGMMVVKEKVAVLREVLAANEALPVCNH